MLVRLADHKSASERLVVMHIEIDEGIGSVLIVEDEMIVAMLMEELVRELGVDEVYVCTDAASALDVVANKAIDLAVLDMKVRDGTTGAVADALADKGIPFIFSSGSDIGALPDRHAARPMVSKPFLDDDFKLVILDTWTLHSSAQGSRPAERVATSGASD
jgi:CheY-like chemotaxis protein